jgi:hypothetical protein
MLGMLLSLPQLKRLYLDRCDIDSNASDPALSTSLFGALTSPLPDIIPLHQLTHISLYKGFAS